MMRMLTTLVAVGLTLGLGGLFAAQRQAGDAEETYAEIENALGQVPSFLREYQKIGVSGAWEGMKGVALNPDTELSAKEKELVALAVAASIPCEYCVYFHSAAAEASGASDQEMSEALAMAAAVRHWSTILNGSDVDLDEFKRETDEIMEHLAEQHAGGE